MITFTNTLFAIFQLQFKRILRKTYYLKLKLYIIDVSKIQVFYVKKYLIGILTLESFMRRTNYGKDNAALRFHCY